MEAVSEENAAIYQAHSGQLVRFATGLVGPSDAADVVASSVLRAMTSRSWPQVTDHKAYLPSRRQRSTLTLPLSHATPRPRAAGRQGPARIPTRGKARGARSSRSIESTPARGGRPHILGGPQRSLSSRPARNEHRIRAAALGAGPATTEGFTQ